MINRLGIRELFENFRLWSNVTPNPTISQIEAARQAFIIEKIERVLAIGGGSVLDTGKALAVLFANPKEVSIESILRHSSNGYKGKDSALDCCATTAGTGSGNPLQPYGMKSPNKKSFWVPVFPDQAVIDSTLLPTSGDEALIYPALDSVSHALESLWNKNRNRSQKSMRLNRLK